ncbi:MAG TPA: hypothetical protein VMM92_09445, partial [Thermoanaerobaculia bacterium]|nr:hypothetical protein [Thermoanaerobaculia bacterium]
MSETDLTPPHVERLLRRVRALEEPLIQVWGWPGTGRAALLEALLAAEAERSLGLSSGDLRGERELREAIERARRQRARFLVASTCTEEQAALAAQWLIPGQHLVFATDRRLPIAAAGAVVSPQELLLEAAEVAVLWHLLTGTRPEPGRVESLRLASDGWYLPLRLAFEATGGAGWNGGRGGSEAPGEETLLEVPAVRSFLRHQVLGSLGEEERQLLSEADPGLEDWASEGGRPAAWRSLIESRGLWVEGAEGERAPRLLAAYLRRQQRRRPRAAALPRQPGEETTAAGGAGATTAAIAATAT